MSQYMAFCWLAPRLRSIQCQMIVCDIKKLAGVHQNTNTYKTHTHCFFVVCRDSLGLMVLYCTHCMCYCLHLTVALRGDCVSTFPTENSLCMIYESFELWGHWKFSHKSPSPHNTFHTHVIIHICLLINHINMHRHTHTDQKLAKISQNKHIL